METIQQQSDRSLPATEVRTFLIADVRGYTQFTVQHGDEAAARLATRFAERCEEVVATHDGTVVELRGDEALAVFSSARQALRAASELQRRFGEESDPSLPLKVGIGLDTGEAVPVKGGYRGGALNLAARLCSLAGPGEVLASDTIATIAGKLDGLDYAERGKVQLKGFADPVRVLQVLPSPPAQSGTQRSDLHGGAGEGELPTEMFSPSAHLPSPARGRGAGGEGGEQRLPIGGFLGALPINPLVARERERAEILQALDAVGSGQGRLLLLAGEPGAGKTRLAQEATLAGRNQGFLVAAGSCFEPRQTVPYYPYLDVLAMLYGAAPGPVRSEVPQRWPYLARLLPEAGIIEPPTGEDTQAERERLFRTITGFIQAIAGQVPVAIFLDDLHWADESSLDLLEHLARHTRADRVLLLGTYRDVEVERQRPLERALRDLHRQGLVERIAVRRLEKEGTAALMAATFDQEEISEEFVSLVQQHTEGNPFFTQEVLRALVERGDIYQENGRWERREIEEIEVPESVRSVIGERLSRLSEESQDLLRMASVLGQTFQFDDLQAVSNQAEDRVEEGLEEASRAGLVRTEGDDAYAFNHALTQQALYAELSPRRKRRLHLAAGEALEGLPERERAGRIAELAWHFLDGDDPERALDYSLRAGDEAEAVFAHGEAAQHYSTAVELGREIGNDERTREALRKLGAVLGLMGRYDTAVEALDEAAGLDRAAGDLSGELDAVTHLMQFTYERGTQREVLRWVDPLLPRLQGLPPSRGLVRFFTVYGEYLLGLERFDEGLSVSERAVEIARALGDEREVAHAQRRLAFALSLHGRVGEAWSILNDVLAAAERTGDLAEMAHARLLLGGAAWEDADCRTSLSQTEQALDLFQRVGNPIWVAFAINSIGEILAHMGEIDRAEEMGRRALNAVRELDQSTLLAHPLGLLARLSVQRGDRAMVDEYAQELIALSDQSDEPWWRRNGQAILAERDLLEGQPEAAAVRLEEVLLGRYLNFHESTWALPLLAEAYVELGRVDEAEELLNRCFAAAGSGSPAALLRMRYVQARLLTRKEQWDKARAILDDLLSLTRSMPNPLDEGNVLHELAQIHLTRKERDEARKRWKQALAIYGRLGAKPYVQRTEQALAELDSSG